MAHSILANRVSHLLGLTGPSEPVDTACSSALVAIHRAVEAIRAGSEMAIAGGVNLILTPTLFHAFERAGMLSPSGVCRPFDAAADGYARGEGVGILVLKPLAEALADGDPVHAVIRGGAIGHGGRSPSLTAPHPQGQAAVLAAAWAAAGVAPETLGYIEAHGTGTPLGDPVEIAGLIRAFEDAAPGADWSGGPCAVGSVKSNIGHLESAAGIAGVIKLVLALQHGETPPTAHLSAPNPQLPASPAIALPRAVAPWPLRRDGALPLPRRGGVSSFGFGGVNAHLVLEEAPARPAPPRGGTGPWAILLSARDGAALRRRIAALAAVLPEVLPAGIPAIADTLAAGRAPMAERFAAVVATGEELAQVLAAVLAGEAPDGRWQTGRARRDAVPEPAPRDPHAAARAFAAGDALVFTPAPGRVRLRLPVYPFADERHWLPGPAGARRAAPPPAPPVPTPSAVPDALRERVRTIVAEASGFAPELIEGDGGFETYGFDSLMAKTLHLRLEAEYGPLPQSLPFECNTLDALAARLAILAPAAPQAPTGSVPLRAAPLPRVASRVAADGGAEPIAIIGLAGRYPGAEDLDAFWRLLVEGREAIGEVPAERWDWRPLWADDAERAERTGGINARWGGFLTDADAFDPYFFRIPPAEAALMDPQERLFVETAWHAFESAGHVPRRLRRAGQRTGVFAGVTTLSHALWGPELWRQGEMAFPAADPWSLANRVSYLLDLTGPSMPVDTACSASLTAIHLAVAALRRGECEFALAGGVNLYSHPAKFVALCRMRMLSPTGRCRAFGAEADGFVPGEGVGAALLRPLREAEAAGDTILAVIRGSAVNHGGRTNGYTVPSPAAQAAVITAALADAGVAAAEVDAIEAHGTGTALGDPIEVDGLARAFGARATPGALGAVKANIGHLEAAAGIAGLTKLVLQFAHETLAPTRDAGTPNPAIDFSAAPFAPVAAARPFPAPARADGSPRPRRAGLSSFGAGGANAHLVIEEYRAPVAPEPAGGPSLLLLSARERPALERLAAALAERLEAADPPRLVDVAATLAEGRETFAERLAVVASNSAEAAARLRAFLAGSAGDGVWHGRTSPAGDGIGGLFEGEGEADLAELVGRWAAAGRLDRIGRAFVMGASPGGAALPRDPAARRIALPLYPFERERFSIVPAEGWQPGTAGAAGAAGLLRGPDVAASLGTGVAWTWAIAPDAPLVAGHRVEGTPVLPGAAILAAASEAAAALRPGVQVALDDIVWLARVEVGEPRRLVLRANPDLSLADDTGVEFAEARLGTPATAPPPDPDVLAATLPETVTADEIYASFGRAGLDYSGAYRGLVAVRADRAGGIAIAELDVSAAPRAVRPAALLDAALQCLSVFAGKGGGAVLPACLDAYRQFRTLPARARVVARVTGSGRYDLTLFTSPGGDPVASLTGLVLRRATRPDGFVFRPTFVAAPAPAVRSAGEETSGLVVIVCPRAARPLGAAIARLHGGGRVVWADPEAEDFAARIERIGGQDCIYHLGALAVPAGGDAADALAAAERNALRPLHLIARRLVETGAAARLVVVTDRLHNAVPAAPAAGLVPAFLRSASRECAGVCLALDVDLGPRADVASVARAIVREAGAAVRGGPPELRLRGAAREILNLAPVRLAPPAAPPLEPGEACAILGGGGGIGLALAERLAAGGVKVALLGRRAEDELGADVRALLHDATGRIVYVRADVARAAALGAGLATAAAKLGVGGFAGFVHAAMVLRDRTVAALTEADLAAVLAPKAHGLVALRECLEATPPRWVCLLSSAQSLIGAAGQANYAAASGFMAAFGARWAAEAEYAVRVLDMGFWGEVGRVATPAYRASLAAEGIGAIGTAEGIETILAALAGPEPRIVPLKARPSLLEALWLAPRGATQAAASGPALPSLLQRLLGSPAGEMADEEIDTFGEAGA